MLPWILGKVLISATQIKIPVYNGPLKDKPLSFVHSCAPYFDHVALFPCSISFMFCHFQCTLFSCCTLSIQHSFHVIYAFHVAIFLVLYHFHVVLFSYCPIFMLLFSCCARFILYFLCALLFSCCTVISEFFFRADFLQKASEQLPLFMYCVNLVI